MAASCVYEHMLLIFEFAGHHLSALYSLGLLYKGWKPGARSLVSCHASHVVTRTHLSDPSSVIVE